VLLGIRSVTAPNTSHSMWGTALSKFVSDAPSARPVAEGTKPAENYSGSRACQADGTRDPKQMP
jgi:hypothetical protein